MVTDHTIGRLAEHARVIGALFTASVLLTNVGTVLADGAGATAGP